MKKDNKKKDGENELHVFPILRETFLVITRLLT